MEGNIKIYEELARKSRMDVLKMVSEKKVGFIGSDFSCIDILTVLYQSFVKYMGNELDRDTVIMSKGHAAAAWYAVLSNCGLIKKSKLQEYNENGYNMGAHPKRYSVSAITTSTGSLGQGLGMACGCALADSIAGKNTRTYVILGDGECNEGSIWEALMFASRYNLSNLTIIIDKNGLQSYGMDKEVLNLGDIAGKLSQFDFQVISIDGHDYEQIEEALNTANASEKTTVIVASTVKGKGVSTFENEIVWHYKWPEGEVFESAMEELKG